MPGDNPVGPYSQEDHDKAIEQLEKDQAAGDERRSAGKGKS